VYYSVLGSLHKHGRRKEHLLRCKQENNIKPQTSETMVCGKLMKKIRFADRLIKRSKKINNRNKIDIYSVPLINLTKKCSIFERFSFGNPCGQVEQRTVLVIGTNGRSKAKFINGIVNFFFNVEKEDNFRFQLIDEMINLHKNCFKIYEIHYTNGFRFPFSLTIVVSPQIYDSKGLGYLRKPNIVDIFQEFLGCIDGIKELDMICNILESGTNQFDFSIFGKDVIENINHWPPLSILDDKYSSLEMSRKCFVALTKKNKNSLLLTKLVLKKRKQIEATIRKLQSLIEIGNKQKDGINSELQIECDDKIDNNLVLNFVQKGEYPVSGYTNNCDYSKFTCQNSFIKKESDCSSNCSDLYDEKNKYLCSVWLEKSRINLHSKQSFLYASVKKENSNLLENESKRNNGVEIKWKEIKLIGQEMINVQRQHLIQNGKIMLELFKKTWRYIYWLNKMALNGNSFLTKKEFYFLFEAEQQLKSLDYQFEEFELKFDGVDFLTKQRAT
jgi:hypothetical protein